MPNKITFNITGQPNKKQNIKLAELEGMKFQLAVTDPDLDLDGNFANPSDWNGKKLWEKLRASMDADLKTVSASAVGKLTKPETCDLEITLGTKTYKAKLTLPLPANSNPMNRTIPNSYVPANVTVNKNYSASDGPNDPQFKGDLQDLETQMAKTDSYSYSKNETNSDGFVPNFNQHNTHKDSETRGWKAYVDQPSHGTGTKWRLYFGMSFNRGTKTLTVNATKIQKDH